MWATLGAPYVAATLLLLAAGVPKLRDPAPLARALVSLGLPAGRRTARFLAMGEVVLAVMALVHPTPATAALISLTYVAFSLIVGYALRVGGMLDSCGCFGRADTPPTRSHFAVTVLFAACSAALALSGTLFATGRGTDVGWGAETGVDVVVAVGGAGLAALGWLALAVLPQVTPAAVRSIDHVTPRRPPR